MVGFQKIPRAGKIFDPPDQLGYHCCCVDTFALKTSLQLFDPLAVALGFVVKFAFHLVRQREIHVGCPQTFTPQNWVGEIESLKSIASETRPQAASLNHGHNDVSPVTASSICSLPRAAVALKQSNDRTSSLVLIQVFDFYAPVDNDLLPSTTDPQRQL